MAQSGRFARMTVAGALADPRVIAWENAAELHGAINEALTPRLLDERLGRPYSLDDPCLLLLTTSARVMGQTGKITRRNATATAHIVAFTVRQTLAMGELLADALPGLAAAAYEARVEHGVATPTAHPDKPLDET